MKKSEIKVGKLYETSDGRILECLGAVVPYHPAATGFLEIYPSRGSKHPYTKFGNFKRELSDREAAEYKKGK